ncbi:DENN domain-containing protein 3-like [Crotalus adamanteus]|uniref:DENN domain-containing protein 3-like n=1 Tax=Crotalus adamanteus TaxID=8729 RepID=A0AAW1BLZ2_CROAD
MSCNKQLNDHRFEIVDIVVDNRESLPSEVYSCSVDGTVIAWNISTLKVNRRFQLPYKTVTSIQFYKNRLWCCIQDDIVVVTTNGLVRQKLKLQNVPTGLPTPLLCFQLFPERDEAWASWSGSSELLIWNMEDFSTPLQKLSLSDCSEITCAIKVKNQMWVGGRGFSHGKVKGKVYVVDMERRLVEKELVGHPDVVKSLCSAEDRYVLSGGGKEEGKIAIWQVEESLGFQFV